MREVEKNALIAGGMSAAMAESCVQIAIDALKGAGVLGPTRIPWGG